MKKNTGILLLLIVLASCGSIKQFRYMSKAKAPKGTFRTEIPFELHNNLIVIKVKLNDSDKEFEFMVDSGAPASVIYKDAYEESKPETVMSYDISDSQGRATKSDYVMLDLTIGNSEFKDIFTAYSPEAAEFIRCISPGGIIGANLMQTANWQIDFENKKLVITDFKSALPDLKDYQKMSCSKRAPFGSMPWLTVLPGLTVDVEIEGEEFKDVYVDLGSSGGLSLPKSDVTEKIFENDLKEVMWGFPSFGLLGANVDTTYYYTDQAIEIGKVQINNPLIDVYKRDQPLMGTRIFMDYLMVIDFRKKNLYLKPTLKSEEPSSYEKELGFHILYDTKSSKCYVATLYEGSPAAMAGLQLSDTIIEINGQPLPVFKDFCEFREWSKTIISQNKLLIKTEGNDEIMKIEEGIIPRR